MAASFAHIRGNHPRSIVTTSTLARLFTLGLWLGLCGATPAASAATCLAEVDGLSVPAGFCISVFNEQTGPARHLAVRPDGSVLVRLGQAEPGGVAVLRDTDGDGKADATQYFDDTGGTGLALAGDTLYLGAETRVLRYRLGPDSLPTGPAQTLIEGFPRQSQHAAKSLALHEDVLYVNVGAPSNACQRRSRQPGSPGQQPCPQREQQAGIWRFATDVPAQQASDGENVARGVRNAVALAWRPGDALYAVQHGRDQLHQLWPDLFDVATSAAQPAEELLRITPGSDFGWPYCYYDSDADRRLLAPEYGGDGQQAGRCGDYDTPVAVFPGHWAPNDLVFYDAEQFPARYRKGAFIAFHGSWNRAPLPQAGYRVVFVPFSGESAGQWETFIDGFAGSSTLYSPGAARYRPTGLAVGPDGSLYVADSTQGRIWRVRQGDGSAD